MSAVPSIAPSRRARHVLTRADHQRYLPLVRRIAIRVARGVPSNIGVAELVASGWTGVIDALERADSLHSAKDFEDYASYRVRGAMLDHLRTATPGTRKLRNASRMVTRAIAGLRASLARPPTEDEIARELGIAVESFRALLGEIGSAGMARLELVDLDQPAPPPGSAVSQEMERPDLGAAVTAGIDELPPHLRRVLALHHEHERSSREIAATLEISEARAVELHAEAMHRLRASIGRE